MGATATTTAETDMAEEDEDMVEGAASEEADAVEEVTTVTRKSMLAGHHEGYLEDLLVLLDMFIGLSFCLLLFVDIRRHTRSLPFNTC